MARSERVRQQGPRLAMAGLAIRVGILAVGLANGWALMTAIPVFNDEARIRDPWGDWRGVAAETLYDPAAYRQTAGVGYLSLAAEAQDPAMAERARELFLASLEEAPGDALTWSLLAWSEAFLADEAAAFRAQSRSWELAPYNLTLAPERLAFMAGLAERFPPDLLGAVRRDIALLHDLPEYREFLADLAQDNTVIAAIVAELESREMEDASPR